MVLSRRGAVGSLRANQSFLQKLTDIRKDEISLFWNGKLPVVILHGQLVLEKEVNTEESKTLKMGKEENR